MHNKCNIDKTDLRRKDNAIIQIRINNRYAFSIKLIDYSIASEQQIISR